MTDSEIRSMIRREIKEVLAPILMATLVSNESSLRSSASRFKGDSPVGNLRNIQPFGFSSRAPANTDCLIIPVAGDPSHLNMVGHFDKTRPEVDADGQSIMYDAFGHIIFLSENKMQFGSKSSLNPMMLGDIVQNLLSNFLDKTATHLHTGNLGYLTTAPTNAEDFENLKSSPVDDGKIISHKCFTED